MTEFNDDDDWLETALKGLLLGLKWTACVLAAIILVSWLATGVAPWTAQ